MFKALFKTKAARNRDDVKDRLAVTRAAQREILEAQIARLQKIAREMKEERAGEH